MVRSLGLLALTVLCTATARADLQLQPKLSEYELDGVKFRQLVFSDGTRDDITYSLPPGWTYLGTGTKLALTPPDKMQAGATITTVKLKEPARFEDETVKTLTQQVLAAVPQGSTDVAIISEEKNPVQIERKETLLVIVRYTFYGQKLERSALFLNRGNEQIRFQLTSKEEDFKELQRTFLGSQFSWQNL